MSFVSDFGVISMSIEGILIYEMVGYKNTWGKIWCYQLEISLNYSSLVPPWFPSIITVTQCLTVKLYCTIKVH